MNRAIANNGYWSATLWPQIITALLLVGTFPLFRKDIPSLKLGQVCTVIGLAIGEVLGIPAFNRALETNVSLTSTIVNLPLSMVITVAIAMIAPTLLESHPKKIYAIRLLAGAIMVSAATQLPH